MLCQSKDISYCMPTNRRREFEQLNKQRLESGERQFMNARNFAAGVLRKKETMPGEFSLHFIAYSLILDDNKALKEVPSLALKVITLNGAPSQEHALHILKELGFETGSLRSSETHAADKGWKKTASIEEVMDFIAILEDQREQQDYISDGAVIKVNSFEQQNKLGERSRTPRWAIAYKFKPDVAVTTLKGVSLQVTFHRVLLI